MIRVHISRKTFTHELPLTATTHDEAMAQAQEACDSLRHRENDPWIISFDDDNGSTYTEQIPLVGAGQGRSAANVAASGIAASICFGAFLFFFLFAWWAA